ncbi:MAG: Permease of the drug/metabolite transporter superfamily [Pseudomonadota bacterium]
MSLLVAVTWGTSYGVAKEAVALYPVLGFLAIRFCLTFGLLLPFWRQTDRAAAQRAVWVGVPLGSILLLIFICETYGVSLTRAANAAFLISTCVVFTPFFEWLVLRARPSPAAFLAAGVSLLGVFLLTAGVQLSFGVGDLLMLAAALLRACMVTFTKKLLLRRSVDALPLTTVQTGTVGLGAIVLSLVVLPGGVASFPSSATFWVSTVYLVVFCTIFAFFAQNYAIQRTSPTRVSLLMGSEPLFGALFAVLWLGESLSLLSWLGGALIVGASLWATLKPQAVVGGCRPGRPGCGS